MRKIWVATYALLLSLALGAAGVTTNNAWAQEGPGTGLPTVEDPLKSGEPAVEGPGTATATDDGGGKGEPTVEEPAPAKLKMPDDCFIQGRHFNYLQGEIALLEKEEARLKGQIATLEVGNPKLVEQLATLNQRLAQVTEQLGDTYLAARPWGGWHLRVGVLVQGTAFSGASNFATPLQLDVSGEWLDARTHLGWRGGMAIGTWFTEGDKDQTLAPLMVTGHMSAVAGWKYWSVLLPQVRASFLQSPTDKEPGFMWVTINGGGEFHVSEKFFVDALLGTSVYSTLQRLGGLHGLLVLGYYY